MPHYAMCGSACKWRCRAHPRSRVRLETILSQLMWYRAACFGQYDLDKSRNDQIKLRRYEQDNYLEMEKTKPWSDMELARAWFAKNIDCGPHNDDWSLSLHFFINWKDSSLLRPHIHSSHHGRPQQANAGDGPRPRAVCQYDELPYRPVPTCTGS